MNLNNDYAQTAKILSSLNTPNKFFAVKQILKKPQSFYQVKQLANLTSPSDAVVKNTFYELQALEIFEKNRKSFPLVIWSVNPVFKTDLQRLVFSIEELDNAIKSFKPDAAPQQKLELATNLIRTTTTTQRVHALHIISKSDENSILKVSTELNYPYETIKTYVNELKHFGIIQKTKQEGHNICFGIQPDLNKPVANFVETAFCFGKHLCKEKQKTIQSFSR